MENENKFNPLDYPEVREGLGRKIPFSDWLPPDFEPVSVKIDGVTIPKHMYYSPAYNCMMGEKDDNPYEIDRLVYWLKRV